MSESRKPYCCFSQGDISRGIQNVLDDLRAGNVSNELKEQCAKILMEAEMKILALVIDELQRAAGSFNEVIGTSENDASVDRNAVLHALSKSQWKSLRGWCKAHGYGYRNASNVLRGVSKAQFGAGREIAEKLTAIVGSQA